LTIGPFKHWDFPYFPWETVKEPDGMVGLELVVAEIRGDRATNKDVSFF